MAKWGVLTSPQEGGPAGLGSSWGNALSIGTDPMDLFGNRARYTANQVSDIERNSAANAIAAQNANIDRTKGLYQPFVDAGSQPLADLVGAFTGGEFNFTPSQAYNTGMEEQSRALRRSAAARGVLDTSGTQARLADLVNALSGQEVQNQIDMRLQPIRTAQDASRLIGSAETAAGGAGSSIYSNLSNQNLQNAANLGQAQQSAYSSLGGGLTGLASLLASRKGQ